MPAHGGEQDDPAVRAVYLVVLAVPLVLTVLAWLAWGAATTFQRVVFPTVIVVHGALLLGLLGRRLATQVVAPWVVVFPAVVVLARLVVWELSPSTRPASIGLVVAAVSFLGVVAALSFLVFGTQRGAQVSIVGFVLFGAGAAWSVSDGMLAASGAVGSVVFVAAGHAMLIGVVWVLARNVDRLAVARSRSELLEQVASTDPLTGIANRRRLDEDLERCIAVARRHDQPFSVALADLDHFKTVNDTFGHEVGDAVLVDAVTRLRRTVRRGDVLGRWGGEEFLLLAPLTGDAEARTLAERCRAAVATTAVDGAAPVTASFGVASLAPTDDARSLVRRADLALSAAKRGGRDRVVGIPAPVAAGEPDPPGVGDVVPGAREPA